MWAKIITIKRTKDLNYFSLCAFNLFNTRVSQFELNYWNKWTFPRHSNLLRCTCVCVYIYIHTLYCRVEELDWSAERQVLIPAEHLWGVFKCRPWAKNPSPNINDLYIWDTVISYTSKLLQKRWKYKFMLLSMLPQFGSAFFSSKEVGVPVHTRGVQLGSGLGFLQTSQVLPHWLNHHSSYTQRHCHVRIEKGSVQTVAIKLEAHNSREYHYMLKH